MLDFLAGCRRCQATFLNEKFWLVSDVHARRPLLGRASSLPVRVAELVHGALAGVIWSVLELNVILSRVLADVHFCVLASLVCNGAPSDRRGSLHVCEEGASNEEDVTCPKTGRVQGGCPLGALLAR